MSSTQQSNVLFITLPWGPAWTLHCPVLPVPGSFYCMPMLVWVMLWGKELLVFTDSWTNLATLDRSFLENPGGTVCWITPLSSWSSVWLCQKPLRGSTEVIRTELSRNQTHMRGTNLRNRDLHYIVVCGYKSLSLSPSKIIFKGNDIFWVKSCVKASQVFKFCSPLFFPLWYLHKIKQWMRTWVRTVCWMHTTSPLHLDLVRIY